MSDSERFAIDLMALDLSTVAAHPATDVLVAEQVMGWKRSSGPGRTERWINADGSPLGDDYAAFNACARYGTPEGAGAGDYYYPDEAWSPTTDIVAAMEVADAIGDMSLRKNARRDTSGKNDWSCYFELERNCTELRQTPWHQADAAALAVCRAALFAVRAQQQKGETK